MELPKSQNTSVSSDSFMPRPCQCSWELHNIMFSVNQISIRVWSLFNHKTYNEPDFADNLTHDPDFSCPFQLDTGIRFMRGHLHKQSLWIRDDSEVKNNITGSHGESHIPSPYIT